MAFLLSLLGGTPVRFDQTTVFGRFPKAGPFVFAGLVQLLGLLSLVLLDLDSLGLRCGRGIIWNRGWKIKQKIRSGKCFSGCFDLRK